MQDVELPPSPPGRLPVVGHTLSFLRNPLACLERWGRRDEDLVRVGIAGRRVCLVTRPAGVREVLLDDADDYRKAEIVRERLGTLQGGSLVLLEGEAWRERRRTLQSGFGPGPVAAVGSLTTRRATATVEAWPVDRSVRVDAAMRDLSLSVLARALFGLDLEGAGTPIHDAADDVLARMDLQSPSTYLPEWVPTPTNRRFRAAVATLHDRLDETVAARASTAGESTARQSTGGQSTGNQPTDLLSVMLAAGLPEETVRDELIAFLFAGFDSTATALSCALGLLGSHAGVQSDLHAELAATLDGATPTPADLDDLPLLDAVVREAVRLYPPQYVLFREPTTDVSLQGYRVDPGTMVVVPPWTLHRDPEHWTDPAAFRPDRWLADDGRDGSGAGGGERDRPECAYLPYGAGPRHCLGMRLARQTMRLVVAVVCQHRRLESADAPSVSAGPTLSLDGGVELRAHRRG
jgi:cytochrome P450